jgi:hypothetical protein
MRGKRKEFEMDKFQNWSLLGFCSILGFNFGHFLSSISSLCVFLVSIVIGIIYYVIIRNTDYSYYIMLYSLCAFMLNIFMWITWYIVGDYHFIGDFLKNYIFK